MVQSRIYRWAVVLMFLLPWQPPQEWEVQIVPPQLAGLQEQRGVVL